MKSITFHRKELYAEVWSTSVSQLSKKYGISTHQIIKACKELNIPRPNPGHWSKVRHGKRVKKASLPKHKINEFTLTLYDVLEKSLDEVLPQGFQSIKVSDRLTNPHYLVKKTYEHLKGKEEDKYGRVKPTGSTYLDVSVSKASLKRAIRIFDAIIKELVRHNYKAKTESNGSYSNAYFCIEQEKVFISIQEEANQIKSKNKEPSYYRNEYIYEHYTTGRLKLTITADRYWSNIRISDNKRGTIESQINKIIEKILFTAIDSKQQRLVREKEDRLAEIQRKEKKRIEREREAELVKRANLEKQAESFTKSQYIYQFVSQIDKRIHDSSFTKKQLKTIETYINWAKEHAKRLDPVEQTLKTLFETEEKTENKKFNK